MTLVMFEGSSGCVTKVDQVSGDMIGLGRQVGDVVAGCEMKRNSE